MAVSTPSMPGSRARTLWPVILLLCVAVQMAWTLSMPDQQWSMPVGLSCIIVCCGAIVAGAGPGVEIDQWRWRLAALGFVFWGLTFLAVAYQNNFLSHKEPISGILSALKQWCFIVVLLPSNINEKHRFFRVIDIFQGFLFALSLMLMTWSALFTDPANGASIPYVKNGYAVIPLLALISYFSQQHRENRKLILDIFLLFSGYGLVSVAGIYIATYYDLSRNSPIWVIGDVVFVLYGIRVARSQRIDDRDGARDGDRETEADKDRLGLAYRRHLSPVFLTTLLLLLTFQIGEKNPTLGMTLAVLGVLLYAARMTFLLDRYLIARDALIVAERMHARLLIDMIHEIRSPLGSVVLNAAMLQRPSGLNEQQAGWVEQIGLGSARVTTMLNDVLEIERIDAGLTGTHRAACDAMAVVHAAVVVVAAQATAAGIAIEVEGDPAATVFVDAKMLERVFINLLTNAVRFTPQGGRIAVTVADDGRDTIVVRVQDDGIGIADALLPTLFDRFSHIGVPLRGHRGSGLGLSICRGLMTAMGGGITIESRAGEGTVAIVRMPRGDRAGLAP